MGSTVSNTKEIKFDAINTDNLKWYKYTGDTNKTGQRRVALLDDLKQVEQCVCSPLWYKNPDELPPGCKQIKFKSRIGSDSQEGEVYLLEYEANGKTNKMVGKIMPISEKKQETLNKNEITIATKVSDLVIEGKSIFFPIVYGWGLCNETVFSTEKFKRLCEEYALKQDIFSKLEGKNYARFIVETRNKNMNELISYARDKGITENFTARQMSNVLLSELAWGDLKQYIEQEKDNITIAMYDNIINQVLTGISHFQKYLNAVHNDLHLGNVLLLFNKDSKRQQYLTCLIHDFGKSKISECSLSTEEKITDYVKFLDSLGQKSQVPDKLRPKLEKTIVFIQNCQDPKDSENFCKEILEYYNDLK